MVTTEQLAWVDVEGAVLRAEYDAYQRLLDASEELIGGEESMSKLEAVVEEVSRRRMAWEARCRVWARERDKCKAQTGRPS
jgi:hypothetical protein